MDDVIDLLKLLGGYDRSRLAGSVVARHESWTGQARLFVGVSSLLGVGSCGGSRRHTVGYASVRKGFRVPSGKPGEKSEARWGNERLADVL